MFFHQLGDQIRLFDHSDHMSIVVLELKLIRKKKPFTNFRILCKLLSKFKNVFSCGFGPLNSNNSKCVHLNAQIFRITNFKQYRLTDCLFVYQLCGNGTKTRSQSLTG